MEVKKEPYKAVKVTDKIYWVGAIDWAVRDFHGYLTSRGTTYNAYLILADKITLIDTVKHPFRDELFARIESVVPLKDIKHIISNHSEMDHSGCLVHAIDAIKPEKVFASQMGAKALAEHFGIKEGVTALKDGDSLDIGGLNLSFMETRMLHWPDSMFTFVKEEGVLFSQDAFGMHIASTERFADEIPSEVVDYEGLKYYANIITPYSPLVLKLLDKVSKSGWDIKIIAPDHGPIWRKDLDVVVKRYAKWAERKPDAKAVIVFDTMWQSTAMMARAISEGVNAGGCKVVVMPLKSCHRSDVITELHTAGALIVGSPTINNNMFPTVADFLYYAKGLRPANLIGQAFGSYGWSGESVSQIQELLSAMKVELVGEPIKSKYVPDVETLERCYHLGLETAKKLKGEK